MSKTIEVIMNYIYSKDVDIGLSGSKKHFKELIAFIINVHYNTFLF